MQIVTSGIANQKATLENRHTIWLSYFRRQST